MYSLCKFQYECLAYHLGLLWFTCNSPALAEQILHISLPLCGIVQVCSMLNVPTDFKDYIKTSEGTSFWICPDDDDEELSPEGSSAAVTQQPCGQSDWRQQVICSGFIQGFGLWSSDRVTVFERSTLLIKVEQSLGDDCSHWPTVRLQRLGLWEIFVIFLVWLW